MSRVATSKASPVIRRDVRPGGGGSSGDIQDEICPVCKSSRYLNASLRFLVNPECYHKMCESCVDRIFSHGPAQCPIAGCRRTLRKHRFREQTFEDIAVEREVDIRRRVAAVFNRREDEFETLRDYNDYLNDVEDITFNLIHNVDLAETTRRFEQYRDAHEREIATNAALAQQESLSYSARQKAEREQARQRREAARREEADERREQEEHRRDLRRRLERGENPDQVAQDTFASAAATAAATADASSSAGTGAGATTANSALSQGPTLKKRMGRQAAAERAKQLYAADDDARQARDDFVIKGLKAKVQAAPDKPVDPFGGLRVGDNDGARRYFALQDEYVWNVLQDARKDPLIRAGGYDVASFSERALSDAFAGLGVFLADEMTERDRAAQDDGRVGTAGAEIAAAQDVVMEDSF